MRLLVRVYVLFSCKISPFLRIALSCLGVLVAPFCMVTLDGVHSLVYLLGIRINYIFKSTSD